MYQFIDNDIYEHIKSDIDRFDTSDYQHDNIYGIPLRNKKVLGVMKDELSGRIMSEFIGLRSKMYTFRIFKSESEMQQDMKRKRQELEEQDLNEQEIEKAMSNLGVTKKLKGIQRAALKTITFEDYYNCLFNNTSTEVNQYLIRSQKHEVHTIEQKKVALNPYDDKRIVDYLHTDTLPWG